eukprot:superscaffoldBa00003583_g17271
MEAVDPQHCHWETHDRLVLGVPKNNNTIYHSCNRHDCVKSANLRKQEKHLCTVGMERQAYQDVVTSCRATAGTLGIKLGPNPPCSQDLTMLYGFDYAHQVHYLSDPLQPGPVYFLVPCQLLRIWSLS